MGQENEESAELVATVKGDHVAMKTWFNNNNGKQNDVVGELRTKYGAYPDFWRDVLGWEGWKEVRRAYLKQVEGGGGGDGAKSTSEEGDSGRRKRRSRWASAAPSDGAGAPAPERKRRSRWAKNDDASDNTNNNTNNGAPLPLPSAPPTSTTGILGLLPGLPAGMTQTQTAELSALQRRLREANAALSTLETDAAFVDSLPRDDPRRSPSPPPVYDVDGVRRNTRAVRRREKLSAERQDCLERIMDLNPALRPPGFVRRRRSRKVYVPVHEHPTYNFIGLIIGPRGRTQKEMEARTGCKIAIRGRGSVKEGARGRRDGRPADGDDEPLHVVVTGDDQKAVDAASEEIQQMLVVIDDEKNVHKQRQLRELALLNGTLKDEEFCHLCGEQGHRSFECPKRFVGAGAGGRGGAGGGITVRCAICGDTSHPTRDCRRNPDGNAATAGNAAAAASERQLDDDYKNFMDDLDGKTTKTTTTAAAAKDEDRDAATVTTDDAKAIAPTCPPAPTTTAATGAVPLPPLPAVAPPAVAAAAAALPPPPPVFLGAPPPPPHHLSLPAMPPPPPHGGGGGGHGYYGPQPIAAAAAPQPQQHHGYYGPPPTQQPQPPHQQPYYDPNAYYQQQGHGHAAQNQYQQNNNNNNYADETAGWDPRTYFGTEHTGGDAGGAGGFNWWEQGE